MPEGELEQELEQEREPDQDPEPEAEQEPEPEPEPEPEQDERESHVHVVRVEPTELNVTEGKTASYEVALDSQPSSPVTVTVSVGTEELAVEPARLTFTSAQWRQARAVTVTALHDEDAAADGLVEASHEVSGGGYARTAAPAVRVTIVEDDVATLAVASARAQEGAGDGVMRFAVRLDRASGRTATVQYATESGTATEGTDYAGASGTLTFPAGTTELAIEVTIVEDTEVEGSETFTVTLSKPIGVELSEASATGTITDRSPPPPPPPLPRLASLQVTGGAASTYPAFASDTYHYALKCANPDTLHVTATAVNSAVTLTLLRADSAHNHVASGSLDTQIAMSSTRDLAIQVGGNGDTATYVVHCLPDSLPDINILAKSAGATNGLLFITAAGYHLIVDYNGVPRYQSASGPIASFRPHTDGPLVAGKRVQYSVVNVAGITIMDADFKRIKTLSPAGVKIDYHDYILGPESYIVMEYVRALRNFHIWPGDLGTLNVSDSVITELAYDGTELATWNSWDHLRIVPDCTIDQLGDYAHLNSLQLVEGDVIASFRHCSQVVRIDRSSGSWQLQWKIGASEEPPDSNVEYIKILSQAEDPDHYDPLGEFCGQHQATLLSNDRLVLFDNGNYCFGPRKSQSIVTRVVEYDISSATEAKLMRAYERPAGHGNSWAMGGVTVLDNGNWLITWGITKNNTVPLMEVASITEVTPDGTAVLHMNLSIHGGFPPSYRVYHKSEENVQIPLNLP